MILTLSKRALLAAQIFQARQDARHYLNGICFAPEKKLYATDGHRLFIGEHSTDELNENVIVQVSRMPRIIGFETVQIDTDTGIALLLDGFGVRQGVALASVVDGKYPDVTRAIPKENAPVSEIGFNAGYLADIERAAKLYNPKWQSVVIKPNGNSSSAIVELPNAYETASVVLMPVRI
ncbi:hypothetical protein Dpoa2040_001422 [Dickeya sp. CFBP 2040]|nr:MULTISPECIES: hypothetical protein [Dickeya]NKI74184.1 hypothetical protein [Dickeya sp. CFBP 2040]UCZ75350.1 hypothetical protein LHK94_20580 [Dickeya zeae]